MELLSVLRGDAKKVETWLQKRLALPASPVRTADAWQENLANAAVKLGNPKMASKIRMRARAMRMIRERREARA
jgi:hypothetical protein